MFQSVYHQKYFFQNFLRYNQQKTLIFQTNTIIHSQIHKLRGRQRTLNQPYCYYRKLLIGELQEIHQKHYYLRFWTNVTLILPLFRVLIHILSSSEYIQRVKWESAHTKALVSEEPITNLENLSTFIAWFTWKITQLSAYSGSHFRRWACVGVPSERLKQLVISPW